MELQNNTKPVMHSLGDQITLIDLMVEGEQGITGCYVIRAERVTLVETGTSFGAPYILVGLEVLGIRPEEVEYIIVTHIHLDHSGGVGKLLPYLPNAKVIVHPRGARHLIDPSRLLRSAHMVYGDELERKFGEIHPVPEEKVITKTDQETLDLGGGRSLTFYDTPGHARHHFSIYDSLSRGVFTGDTVGIRYVKQVTGVAPELIFPAAAPPEFDKQAALTSIARLEALNPSKVFHGHFGMTEPASAAFAQMRTGLEALDSIARACYKQGGGIEDVREKLWGYMVGEYTKQGYVLTDLSCFALDTDLNSKGLWFSLEKEAQTD